MFHRPFWASYYQRSIGPKHIVTSPVNEQQFSVHTESTRFVFSSRSRVALTHRRSLNPWETLWASTVLTQCELCPQRQGGEGESCLNPDLWTWGSHVPGSHFWVPKLHIAAGRSPSQTAGILQSGYTSIDWRYKTEQLNIVVWNCRALSFLSPNQTIKWLYNCNGVLRLDWNNYL